jgi:hypothetical protein
MNWVTLFDLAVLLGILPDVSSLASTTTSPPFLRRSSSPTGVQIDDSSEDARVLQEILSNESTKDYYLWTAQEIQNRLLALAGNYSDFVRLTTAQEAYGLPASGEAGDCPFDTEIDGCFIYILTLQDYVIHPEGSNSSKRLPEVLLNGALHGDERVGPTAVMETAELLLQAARCEESPNKLRVLQTQSAVAWQEELAYSTSCRSNLLKTRGIDDRQRQWLARLLSTRRVVILPTANAVGYYRNEREEIGIDVNRDFPYDKPSLDSCMRSIAARALNELVRNHMFQMALAYHAGVSLLGYEWGVRINVNLVSFSLISCPSHLIHSHKGHTFWWTSIARRFSYGFDCSRSQQIRWILDWIRPLSIRTNGRHIVCSEGWNGRLGVRRVVGPVQYAILQSDNLRWICARKDGILQLDTPHVQYAHRDQQ